MLLRKLFVARAHSEIEYCGIKIEHLVDATAATHTILKSLAPRVASKCMSHVVCLCSFCLPWIDGAVFWSRRHLSLFYPQRTSLEPHTTASECYTSNHSAGLLQEMTPSTTKVYHLIRIPFLSLRNLTF